MDYEKAHDSISWDFHYYMISRLGLCNRLIRWIMECLKSSTISILINGSLTKQFNPTRGLRQDDPIIPFLFLNVVQGLLGMVNQIARKQLYT